MPLFGVCMGHQCIGEVFGGRIVRAPAGVMHGKVSPVTHTNVGLLEVRQCVFLISVSIVNVSMSAAGGNWLPHLCVLYLLPALPGAE